MGQWRVITRVLDNGVYEINKPWRLVPAPGDWVTVQPIKRNNIVYNNYMCPAPEPEDIVRSHKNTGVFFHHQAFDNIVANNSMKNIGQGLAIGMDYAQPCAWNVYRENRMENVTGNAGGTAPDPCFYIERLTRPPATAPYLAHTYGLGNVFRANTGDGADAAGMVGYSYPNDRRYPSA